MTKSCVFLGKDSERRIAASHTPRDNRFVTLVDGFTSPAPLRMLRVLAVAVVTGLIPFSASGAEGTGSTTQATGKDQPSGARVVHFPADQSIGRLFIDTGAIVEPWALSNGEGYYQWEYFREARGDVLVPAGKCLRLHLAKAALDDLSPLKKLGPNDLYRLTITGFPDDPAHPDKTVMPYLSGLTGLRELDLQVVCISENGLRHIKDLKSLKNLLINTDKSLSAGMSYVGGLTSLEILFLGGRCSDSSLRHLLKLTSLKTLYLDVVDIRGPGLVHLQQLRSLRNLGLMGMHFSDGGLAYLRNMTSLKELTLYGNNWPLTDAGLAHLSGLTGVENLDLHNIKGITDSGLAYLKPMRSLKKLDLYHSQVTDAGLAHLKEMKSLESLELPQQGITDKGLAELSGLTQLKDLTVGGSSDSPISDAGLRHLAKLPLLEGLQVVGTGITDTGMSQIARMSHLNRLSIGVRDGQVTNDGLAQLVALKHLKNLSLWQHPDLSRKRFHPAKKITVSGLASLNALPSLKTLRVDSVRQDNTGLNLAQLGRLESLMLTFEKGSAIRDEDLACLKELKHLNNLQIPHGAVTDAGLAHLSGLSSMERLVIGGPGLTDQGVKHLANMHTLADLWITGNLTDEGLKQLEGLEGLKILSVLSTNNFSGEAVERLRKKLPNLQVLSADRDRDISRKVSPPKIGEVAPPFRVTSLDGSEIKLDACRGRFVLLYFWATWCNLPPASIEAMKEFHRDLSRQGDFVMISLSMDEDASRLRSFLTEHRPSWPQVRLGVESKVAASYGVTGAPTHFVIGPDGKIISTDMSWQQLRETIINARGSPPN